MPQLLKLGPGCSGEEHCNPPLDCIDCGLQTVKSFLVFASEAHQRAHEAQAAASPIPFRETSQRQIKLLSV